MNARENLLNSSTEIPVSQDEKLDLKSINTIKKNNEITSDGGTLRRRLLMTVLPTVLIPLAVASTIGSNVVHRNSKEIIVEDKARNVVLINGLAREFLQQGLNLSNVLANNPLVIQELQAGSQKTEVQGLLQQPIEEVEKQFASTKLLNPNPDLNRYLKVIIENNGLAEIILTERNGFNVAYSSPTSDFVQRDEKWWQIGEKEGAKVLEPEFDESTQSAVIELVNALKHPDSGEFLGVTKVGVSVIEINKRLSIGLKFSDSEQLQIIDSKSGKALNSLTSKGAKELGEIIGSEALVKVVQVFAQTFNNSDVNLEKFLKDLEKNKDISNIKITNWQGEKLEANTKKIASKQGQNALYVLSFEQGKRYFSLSSIPNTGLVVVSSVQQAEIAAAGRNLMKIFASTAAILGIVATGLIILLARNLSQPLATLTAKAQQVARGDLDVQVQLEGTEETRTLADNFNQLVQRVKGLIQEQETVAKGQQQEKETLEQGIYQLIEDLQDAVDGDLTVRAHLSSIEMSTVADLFNAIIDSLREIAIQVKDSSIQVSASLDKNEQSIQLLAQQAIKETEETRETLGSVEQMSHSIEEVATNANQAASLVNDAYQETQAGSQAMDETVNSILSLRTTVGETAKKMKRLGESSQRISQVVSLIEEIALKTNLLAINASVEASRAGEQGQGFTVVAEQVGALAEQSASATKEIAKMVAAIQAETQEVSQEMELGTSQVVDTTRLVEATKQRLEQVLERSRAINELMHNVARTVELFVALS